MNQFQSYCRHFASISLCVAMSACTHTKPLPEARTASDVPSASTILRVVSYPDSTLAAQSRGRLEVAVRSTDRPTEMLASAQLRLRIGPRDSLLRTTIDRGLAVFESVPVGEHELQVRRIGYGNARAIVSIKAGCRTDAEAYVAISAIGIAIPPPMPGRIAQTTCR